MKVIEAIKISKQYNISLQSGKYFVLRDKIKELVSSPISLLRKKDKPEVFWALKDIELNVEDGEILGIVGHNGAGKSTLLKILSKITPPTEGMVKIKGKTSSLLEIGTGFHPELTGRENIFLNGVILGMSERDIRKKFDEIIEFSGVENFLDMPVKHYSSGMYVRLAFAVAAHMDAEIILIDEILSVGDAKFQKKCLGKINEITSNVGRTVIFISHNLSSIREICSRCLLLAEGRIVTDGKPEEVIRKYLDYNLLSDKQKLADRKDRRGAGGIKFIDIKVENFNGSPIINSGDKIRIKIKYLCKKKEDTNKIKISLVLYNYYNYPLLRFDNTLTEDTFDKIRLEGIIICETDNLIIGSGNYYFNVAIWSNDKLQDFVVNAVNFCVEMNNSYYNFTNNNDQRTDNVLIPHRFKLI